MQNAIIYYTFCLHWFFCKKKNAWEKESPFLKDEDSPLFKKLGNVEVLQTFKACDSSLFFKKENLWNINAADYIWKTLPDSE